MVSAYSQALRLIFGDLSPSFVVSSVTGAVWQPDEDPAGRPAELWPIVSASTQLPADSWLFQVSVVVFAFAVIFKNWKCVF